MRDNPDPLHCGIPEPNGRHATVTGTYEDKLVQPIVHLTDSHSRNQVVGQVYPETLVEVDFGVHMAISAVIGGIYGLVAGRLPQSAGMGVLAGAINGVVWWVLGALVMMPLMLGMSNMVLQIGQAQWMSLVGHLIFGVVTGLLFVPLSKRI